MKYTNPKSRLCCWLGC